MPTIKFSDAAMDDMVSYTTSNMTSSNPKFFIMQGTPPTQTEFNAAGSNFRSSDELWEAFTNGGKWVHVDKVTMRLDYIEAVASATGTATWWHHSPYYNSSGAYGKIMGTISTPGGGGDLIISTTSFVSGQTYGVGPINISFNQIHTV